MWTDKVIRDEELPEQFAFEINDLDHYRLVIHAEQLPPGVMNNSRASECEQHLTHCWH
jgi:hypothetical protein